MKSLQWIVLATLLLGLGNFAYADCPPEGCPKGQVCVGNPIYSVCQDKNNIKPKETERQAQPAPTAVKTVEDQSKTEQPESRKAKRKKKREEKKKRKALKRQESQ